MCCMFIGSKRPKDARVLGLWESTMKSTEICASWFPWGPIGIACCRGLFMGKFFVTAGTCHIRPRNQTNFGEHLAPIFRVDISRFAIGWMSLPLR